MCFSVFLSSPTFLEPQSLMLVSTAPLRPWHFLPRRWHPLPTQVQNETTATTVVQRPVHILTTDGAHLIQLGLRWPKVIRHVLLDLGGLPTQCFPELWGLLALYQQRDLCLPFSLILVNFLCEEPEGRCKALARPTPPQVTMFLCTKHPGCLGRVQSSYLALVVLLSVAWAPRHTQMSSPLSSRKTNLDRSGRRGCNGPHAVTPRASDLTPNPSLQRGTRAGRLLI